MVARKFVSSRERRAEESLVAAYERLWALRHHSPSLQQWASAGRFTGSLSGSADRNTALLSGYLRWPVLPDLLGPPSRPRRVTRWCDRPEGYPGPFRI